VDFLVDAIDVVGAWRVLAERCRLAADQFGLAEGEGGGRLDRLAELVGELDRLKRLARGNGLFGLARQRFQVVLCVRR
jgi:hypothetical protein